MIAQVFSKGTAGYVMSRIAMMAVVAADCGGSPAFAAPVAATTAFGGADDSSTGGCNPSPSEVFRITPGTVVLPEPDAATLQAAALKVHNDARAAVGVEALSWDSELARGAQYWASMIVKTGVNKHDPDTNAGEEITGGDYGALLTPEQLMAGFVAEKAWFHNVPFPAAVQSCDGRGTGPGHYFGLIRRAAYRIGCGVGSKDRYRVIVCRINPGFAPDGEMAYPETSQPWPARTPDNPPSEPWVEAARYDVAKFKTDLTAINTAVRPGLVWDDKLADDAHWDARKRMLTDKPWEPQMPAGQFMSIASHGGNSDVTDYPPADVQYRDWMNDTRNADRRTELASSSWTKVGCGTAIRPVGAENRRMVICRYS